MLQKIAARIFELLLIGSKTNKKNILKKRRDFKTKKAV